MDFRSKTLSSFLAPEDPDAEMEDEDEMQSVAADFEIGHMLRDSIIPKAVLFYTGEAGEEDDDVRSNSLCLDELFLKVRIY